MAKICREASKHGEQEDAAGDQCAPDGVRVPKSWRLDTTCMQLFLMPCYIWLWGPYVKEQLQVNGMPARWRDATGVGRS